MATFSLLHVIFNTVGSQRADFTDVNLNFACLHRGKGLILNISSGVLCITLPLYTLYAASKVCPPPNPPESCSAITRGLTYVSIAVCRKIFSRSSSWVQGCRTYNTGTFSLYYYMYIYIFLNLKFTPLVFLCFLVFPRQWLHLGFQLECQRTNKQTSWLWLQRTLSIAPCVTSELETKHTAASVTRFW